MMQDNCTYCRKTIVFGVGEIFTLKVELLETKRDVIFCSKKCMDNNLSNLNVNAPSQFEHVFIAEQSIISENPLIMLVKLEPKTIKTEIISIT